jgi:hypothetical protein
MGEGRDKGEWWRGWIQVCYVWYTVRTFVHAIMYPYPESNKKMSKKKERKYWFIILEDTYYKIWISQSVMSQNVQKFYYIECLIKYKVMYYSNVFPGIQ